MVCGYGDEASAVAKLARCMVEMALSHAGRPERRQQGIHFEVLSKEEKNDKINKTIDANVRHLKAEKHRSRSLDSEIEASSPRDI